MFEGNGSVPMLIMREPAPQPIQPQEKKSLVPDKALFALKYLEFCKAVEAQRPVVYPTGEHGGECKVIDGQELAPSETLARDSAAEYLESYFKGTSKFDIYEREEKSLTPTLETTCFCVVAGQAVKLCPICNGKGKMHIAINPELVKKMSIQENPIVVGENGADIKKRKNKNIEDM